MFQAGAIRSAFKKKAVRICAKKAGVLASPAEPLSTRTKSDHFRTLSKYCGESPSMARMMSRLTPDKLSLGGVPDQDALMMERGFRTWTSGTAINNFDLVLATFTRAKSP